MFNGHQSNFYINEAYYGCSLGDADTDAIFFCESFYGPEFRPTSYNEGDYSVNGKSLGWLMHKVKGCGNEGEPITGTNCDGVKCHIFQGSGSIKGLYDIVCTKGSISVF